MSSVCIWNGDSSGWKTRRKDIVSKDQGVTRQSQWQLPGLRGLQSVMERPLDWIRTHSPAFASHTQEGGLCSSKLILSLPEHVLSRLLDLLSSQKGWLICTLNTRESICHSAGPQHLRTHRLWNTETLQAVSLESRQGLCGMSLTPPVYLTLMFFL